MSIDITHFFEISSKSNCQTRERPFLRIIITETDYFLVEIKKPILSRRLVFLESF